MNSRYALPALFVGVMLCGVLTVRAWACHCVRHTDARAPAVWRTQWCTQTRAHTHKRCAALFRFLCPVTRGACPSGADGDTSRRHPSSLKAGSPGVRSRQGCLSARLTRGDPPAGPPGGWGRQGCFSARFTRGDPPAGKVPGALERAIEETHRHSPPVFAHPPAHILPPSRPSLPVTSQVAESRVGKPAIRGGKMIVDQEIFTSAGTLLLGSENTTWKVAQTYCHRRGSMRV